MADWKSGVGKEIKDHLSTQIQAAAKYENAYMKAPKKGNAQLWVAIANLSKQIIDSGLRIKYVEGALKDVDRGVNDRLKDFEIELKKINDHVNSFEVDSSKVDERLRSFEEDSKKINGQVKEFEAGYKKMFRELKSEVKKISKEQKKKELKVRVSKADVTKVIPKKRTVSVTRNKRIRKKR